MAGDGHLIWLTDLSLYVVYCPCLSSRCASTPEHWEVERYIAIIARRRQQLAHLQSSIEWRWVEPGCVVAQSITLEWASAPFKVHICLKWESTPQLSGYTVLCGPVLPTSQRHVGLFFLTHVRNRVTRRRDKYTILDTSLYSPWQVYKITGHAKA